LVNLIKKIVCDQQVVELCFLEDQFVSLMITKQCEILKIVLEKKSAIKLIIEFDPEVEINLSLECLLHEDSKLQIVPIYFTNKFIHQKIVFFLSGNRSQINLKGMAILSENHEIKIETEQRHQGVETSSSINILSILKGSSSFDYAGLIHIEKGASGTNAEQQNKNILLSTASQVRSIPTIEVLNKNVKCFHGSAVGAFDQNQLYYLKSRGLDQLAAEEILIDALIAPVIHLIPWKEKLKAIITKNLA
jgi:Fe-S cluster assembly protein SufD